jgi:hypothetical protein
VGAVWVGGVTAGVGVSVPGSGAEGWGSVWGLWVVWCVWAVMGGVGMGITAESMLAGSSRSLKKMVAAVGWGMERVGPV